MTRKNKKKGKKFMKKIIYALIALFAVVIGGFFLTNSTVSAAGITFEAENTTIYKDKNGVLLKNDILELIGGDFTGDAISLDIKSDQYSGNGNVVGEYNIVVVATSGSESLRKTYKIKVVDGLYFDYAYNDKVFVSAGKHLTKDQFAKGLKLMEILPNIDMSFTCQCDDYFDYSDAEGEFACTYSYVATNGESGTGEITINVLEESIYDISVDKDVNVFQNILDFIIQYKLVFIIVGCVFIVGIIWNNKRR